MDKDYLNSVGKFWTSKDFNSDIVITPQLQDKIDAICGFLTKKNPKSVLITGDKGVGKSTIIHLVSEKLASQKWAIFSATAANLMAGQRYIGDLELSVQRVVSELTSKKKVLWIVTRFHELYYGGRHEFSPVSILDHLFPHIESGSLKIISESDNLSLEKVIQKRPQVLSSFEISRVNALNDETTLDLVKQWIEKDNAHHLWDGFKDDDLEESYAISNQYLSFTENPGRLIDLLKQTKVLVETDKEHKRSISLKDVFTTISNITGLPKNILDDNEKLDLEHLQDYFATKVIGQKDAVDTITERIAMIKAGLTDPDKPAGVFLFVGPTGTGKTEIAKSFAEYLFGSADRLIRLDMSEYQTFDSSYKIFGDTSDISENTALVNVIRRYPFSVVLLDEFEKAHPNIWDIFLQVFDDGRLTDQKGALADFRHSIIILTSNIGASIPNANSVGFKAKKDRDLDSNVMKSIYDTFRPEFINRLDKIVVFNPLTKSVAKTILKNELKKVLERRGIRQRKWELDFEDSALEFLLDKGFSSEFGARPLKRAIEKYLLAPLAITIVNHNFPSGNQFLLVNASKQKLKVQFIDPDEPEYNWDQKKEILKREGQKAEHLELSKILLDPKGILSEFKVIQKELNALNDLVAKEGLFEKKDELLSDMSTTEFWSSPERYETLAEIEYIDRFESVIGSTNVLFERLHNPEKERLSYDPKLIKNLTQKIYLLKQSFNAFIKGEAQDTLLLIHCEKKDEATSKQLEHMYKAWAKSRGMRSKKLGEFKDGLETSVIYSFIGFGSYAILKQETGYHIFEHSNENDESTSKSKVKIVALPMELEDIRQEDISKIKDKFENVSMLKNLRRYKIDKPTKVKDLKHVWQTAKIELVLNGHFDLF